MITPTSKTGYIPYAYVGFVVYFGKMCFVISSYRWE